MQESFVQTYLTAIIFLAVLFFIVLFLIIVYVLLKRFKFDGSRERCPEEDNEDVKLLVPISAKSAEEAVAVAEEDEEKENDREHNCRPQSVSPLEKVVKVDADSGRFLTSKVDPAVSTPRISSRRSSTILNKIRRKITRPWRRWRRGGRETDLLLADARSSYSSLSAQDHSIEGMEPGDSSLRTRSSSMESFLSTTSALSSYSAHAPTPVDELFGGELSPARLQLTLEYLPASWKLKIWVKRADSLIHVGLQVYYWQVHVVLMPFKRQRFKTKYKSTSTPVYNTVFEVPEISLQTLPQLSLRFRVYGKTGRMATKRLAGEVDVPTSRLVAAPHSLTQWFVMERRKSGNLKQISENSEL